MSSQRKSLTEPSTVSSLAERAYYFNVADPKHPGLAIRVAPDARQTWSLCEVVQYWYAAPPAVPASQVNPARPHRTDAHKCAWHTFFRRSLLQRCVPADARVDVYLWIRTATIAASMTA